jgi:hypothetical protein
MSDFRTSYQESYWNYGNPFGIEEDKYEQLVKSRVSHLGFKKAPRRIQQRDFNVDPRKPPPPTASSDGKKSNRGQRQAESQMRHTGGQTFVSSDTKPLKMKPRVITHLPTPAAKVITLNESSTSY